MSAAEFRRIAKDAERQAAALEGVTSGLNRIAGRTYSSIAATASKEDERLIALVRKAEAETRKSAKSFRQAARSAQSVADQLDERDKDRRRDARSDRKGR